MKPNGVVVDGVVCSTSVIEPCAGSVNVHVTADPAGNAKDTPPVTAVVASGDPSAVHVTLPRSQPAGTVSLSERVPGATSVHAVVPLPPWVTTVCVPTPDNVKSKLPSPPTACFTTVTDASFVSNESQTTSAPGASVNETEEPSVVTGTFTPPAVHVVASWRQPVGAIAASLVAPGATSGQLV